MGTVRRWLVISTAHIFTHQRASLIFYWVLNRKRTDGQLCVTVCVWVVPVGEGEVRCEQLDMVIKWIGDFQAANAQPEEEVAFDVLCGDFNFDNCSPGLSLTSSFRSFYHFLIVKAVWNVKVFFFLL